MAVVSYNMVIVPVRLNKQVSMMFDETTDCATISQMCAAYGIVHKGQTKIVFGGLKELPAGDADTVVTAWRPSSGTAWIRWRYDFWRPCRRTPTAALNVNSTDGASTLMGHKTGVNKRQLLLSLSLSTAAVTKPRSCARVLVSASRTCATSSRSWTI
jgi:hypothetical protein